MKDSRYLSKNGFKDLVTGLIKSYRVFGGVKKDGFPAFGRILNFNDLVIHQTPTHLSAKEFMFPQREVLLRFNIEAGEHDAVVESDEQVLIGLHACDIHGVRLMDRVFSSGVPDVNYLARRSKTIIIGVNCTPDESCFCKSLGTDEVEDGFDLFIHDIKSGYLVRAATEAGEKLLNKHSRTKKAGPKELKEEARAKKNKEALYRARIEVSPSELPDIYSKSGSHPVWERIGAICYGCGSCNNVCPTCYCFDVKDEVKSDITEGVRVRVWDACTLTDFAKVAGGHNFRKTRAQRLKHRFNRKFNYLTDRFGSLFCVGCGRCSRTCLVRINISEVTNELAREYRK